MPSVVSAAAGIPTQVVLDVQQPRVVLVRRFTNNVLYVLKLVSHEVDAAGKPSDRPQPQPQSQPPLQRQPQQARQQQQGRSAGSPSAVFMLTLTGVQVGGDLLGVQPAEMHACSVCCSKQQWQWLEA